MASMEDQNANIICYWPEARRICSPWKMPTGFLMQTDQQDPHQPRVPWFNNFTITGRLPADRSDGNALTEALFELEHVVETEMGVGVVGPSKSAESASTQPWPISFL